MASAPEAERAKRRAPFIVIEGLDRSGKTTQTALLQDRLRDELGASVRLMKFPDRTTPIGQMIDSYLKSTSDLDDHVIHLLFSANRWELASTIESLLNEGTTVLCDRYAFSGIAFSASKVSSSSSPSVIPSSSSSLPPSVGPTSSASLTPTGALASVPKLPFEWCRAPDIGLPSPDVVLFLDISPEKAKERGGYGEERYEKEEMQKRVREVFGRIGGEINNGGAGGALAAESAVSAGATTAWHVVDAGRDVETVAADLWAHVQLLVSSGVDGPIGRLWTDKLL
ncbi:P-loop containing nucleoside triphosphate hydrolase protein [Coprinopsis sp. MPI-PUGE-AT-0042]|nr:P-loop containing nucleoside triphosphate hydrolase protein [Coprinopsis sp. MPI-PUGE-AT-0042]